MKIIFIFLLGFLSSICLAQDNDHDHEAHNHDSYHSHHRNEIGIAQAPVYFIGEKEFSYGLHILYIHNLPNSKFGLGLGYERIFDEHKHNTIGAVISYRLTDPLVFNLSPGLTFEDNDEASLLFAAHFEVTYEFEINNFHLGPVFEIAYDPEDWHISLGLHLGLGF